MTFSFQKSDSIGIISSGLCLIHCLATPFLFVAQAQVATSIEKTTIWWSSIDFIFLFISLFAIYKSSLNSSKKWMKSALWVTWSLLALIILNEKLGIIEIPEETIYFPALGLIGLHFYNSKYCKCENDNCCADTI